MLAARPCALRRGRCGSGHQRGVFLAGSDPSGFRPDGRGCDQHLPHLPGADGCADGPDQFNRGRQPTTGKVRRRQGGSPFAWLNEQGSPTLKSETADTWTGGIVFAQLSDSPWISGFSGSVDWWQVNIKNAIELENPDTAAFDCYGAGNVTTIAQAQAQAATLACQNVGRNLGTGAGSTVLLSYANSATIGEAGIDIELNWIAQLSDLGLKNVPGAITFTSQDTFLDYFRTKNSPANFDVTTNWKDSSGPNPGRHGRRRVWLPPQSGYRLCAAFVRCQPALEVPAFGEHGLPCRPAGDHCEQCQGCCRWRGHGAQLRPGYHHRGSVLEHL